MILPDQELVHIALPKSYGYPFAVGYTCGVLDRLLASNLTTQMVVVTIHEDVLDFVDVICMKYQFVIHAVDKVEDLSRWLTVYLMNSRDYNPASLSFDSWGPIDGD